MIFVANISFAQVAQYGKLSKNNESYKSYKSKNGDIISVGDSLIIGKAMDPSGFRFISQGGGRMHPTHGGKPFVITKIKSYGKDKSGYSIWLNFKGYGLLPVEVDYENAIEAGEIIDPYGTMSRQQAIDKLRKPIALTPCNFIAKCKSVKLPLARQKLRAKKHLLKAFFALCTFFYSCKNICWMTCSTFSFTLIRIYFYIFYLAILIHHCHSRYFFQNLFDMLH